METDIERLANNIVYMKYQLWALYGILIVAGTVLGYLAKTAFEDLKIEAAAFRNEVRADFKVQTNEITAVKERLARKDGEGDIGESISRGMEQIADAIDRKHTRR